MDAESASSCYRSQRRAFCLSFSCRCEVLEAIAVGIEMGGDPATAHARFALEVMEAVFPAQT